MTKDFATVDHQHLNILHQAIGEDFKPLIPAYFEQSEDILNKLGQSFQQQDKELLVRSAHSLKSSSYNLGAFQLSEYSRQLEEGAVADASHERLEQLIELINSEYPDVKQSLSAYLESIG